MDESLKNDESVFYMNKIPLRFLYISEVVIGTFLICFFLYLFKIEIYMDIWIFAGPLLGLAMLITGLTASKIKKIYVQDSESSLVIMKETLFKKKVTILNRDNLEVQLKLDGGRNNFITKIRMILLDNGKEIEKMESGFLSMNNTKIENLYYRLKDFIKQNDVENDYVV